MTPSLEPNPTEGFGDRYAIVRYRSGAVVADLASGNYFRVNASAARVCELLTESTDAAGQVAREFGIDEPEAAELISGVVSSLSAPAVLGTPQGSYHFYPTNSGGYVLRHRERTVLEVAEGRLDVRLPPGSPAPREGQLELYLRALAPKLLFQRGVTVLHASSCLIGGKLMAFAGLSGAGKTTTVRALVACGAKPVSEDLVVLSPLGHGPMVALNGESFVQGWARTLAPRLLAQPQAWFASELGGASAGETIELSAITFVDRARRRGTEIASPAINEVDALLELLSHGFLGSKDRVAWRRFLSATASLVSVVSIYEGWTPDGLEHLPAAARRYISSIAS